MKKNQMQNVASKEVKINSKPENTPNPYLKLVSLKQVKDNSDIDVEKVLRYNGKFVKVCIWILITLLLISLFGMKFIHILFVVLLLFSVVFLTIFVGIDIVNRAITKKSLKKYDINDVRQELLSNSVIKLNDTETYLTKNYIISNSNSLKITKYSEIEWIYLSQTGGGGSYNGTLAAAYIISGTPLIAHLNGKEECIALVKNTEQMNAVFGQVFEKNKNVLIGYSVENIKKYLSLNNKYKYNFLLSIENICFIAAVLFVVILFISSLF